MSEIDLTVINGCKLNKRKSQEQLFKLLYNPILRICMIYAHNRETAEDYLQNGFIKIFNNISKYDGKGNFEGWAKRVVRNMIFDELRIKKQFMFIDDLELTNIPEDVPEINEKYYNVNIEDIITIVQSLPTKLRTVFNLKVFENLTHKEISELLSISDGTSKAYYHRARIKIIERLNKILENN